MLLLLFYSHSWVILNSSPKMSVKWPLVCSWAILFTTVDKPYILSSFSIWCYLLYWILFPRSRVCGFLWVRYNWTIADSGVKYHNLNQGTMVSSSNKTDSHDTAEILLIVVLNTYNPKTNRYPQIWINLF